jgi:hypothetical protein
MCPQFLFGMALIDIDSPVTGVDTLLTKFGVDCAEKMQTNGEFDTKVGPAELEPFVIRYS